MAFDPMPASGSGGSHEPWCAGCNAPITNEQRGMHVHFDNDPDGHRGLTGLYHEACGKAFQSLARVINLNLFGRF